MEDLVLTGIVLGSLGGLVGSLSCSYRFELSQVGVRCDVMEWRGEAKSEVDVGSRYRELIQVEGGGGTA
jgi:hypothetical protein